MNKQIEITEKTPLLNDDGTVKAVGWSRRCIIDYNKDKIAKSLLWRKKEWDFYQTSDGEWMVQLNFANISIGAVATCCLLNLRTGEKYDFLGLELFTFKRLSLASKSAEDESIFEYKNSSSYLKFEIKKDYRELSFKGKKGKTIIDVFLKACHLPENESITIVTPFSDPRRFFLTTKYNCMATSGYVNIDEKKIVFDPQKTYTVLDWGRGVWPHKNYWYWGNGAKVINGKTFGFEITWGIGDTSNATETCVFYDGKAHKIGAVDVEIHPKEQGFMKPWVFISDDGRFNMKMTPYYDNDGGMLFMGLIGMKTHQVHGFFNGNVTLDDGTVLEIHDMYAFCEYVENLW